MKYFLKHKFLSILLLIFTVFIYQNYTKPISLNQLVDKKSTHYTNELYMSNGRVYKNYLNENQKKVYMLILNNSLNRKSKILIDCKDYNCHSASEFSALVHVASDALLTDHPELLSFAFYSIDTEDNKIYLRLEHSVMAKTLELIGIERMKRIIEEIKLKTQDMSDEEKIKYVYTWIGNNNTYDTYFTFDSKNQSIYNVFMRRNAVCAGFAKASQVIFQNIGIESYAVTGYSTGPHMWNIVKLNGKFYNYDSTAAAGRDENAYYYYRGLQSDFMKNYTFDHPEWYPKIEVTDMNIK